jgi:ribosomal protein S18 acetylase RimI-like enzyme
MPSRFTVAPLTDAWRPAAARLLTERWGGARIVSRGRAHDASALPGFVAGDGQELLGLVTYHVEGDACEVVSLDSRRARAGVATALLAAVAAHASAAGCRRLWLITSNDNLHALGFYQRRGWRLVAVHRGAIDAARRLKPAIPLVGLDGIPLHDEIELELALDPA